MNCKLHIDHDIYEVVCKECGSRAYVMDNCVCPYCGQDEFKELSRSIARILIDQQTGATDIEERMI